MRNFGVTLFASLIAVVAVSTLWKKHIEKEQRVYDQGVVVVTGASSGIGKDAAEYIANRGFTVLAGVRKESDAERIRAMGYTNLLPLMIDVTNHEQCVAALEVVKHTMLEKDLPFVGLINNAGISRMAVLEFHQLQDVKRIFDTNVFGMLDIVQQLLPLIRRSQGRIVFVSSVCGKFAPAASGAYAASKHAIEGFADTLRREVQDAFGVSVSVVQPGIVKTPLLDAVQLEYLDALYEHVGPEDLKLYRTYTEEEQKKVSQILETAVDSRDTVEAIFEALTSPRPRTRYSSATMGGVPSGTFLSMVHHLPDRVMDYLALLG